MRIEMPFIVAFSKATIILFLQINEKYKTSMISNLLVSKNAKIDRTAITIIVPTL